MYIMFSLLEGVGTPRGFDLISNTHLVIFYKTIAQVSGQNQNCPVPIIVQFAYEADSVY